MTFGVLGLAPALAEASLLGAAEREGYSIGFFHDDPKPDPGTGCLRRLRSALAGASKESDIVPSTPAHGTPAFVTSIDPHSTIRGCPRIVWVPDVGAPLPDIAMHVVKAESIGQPELTRDDDVSAFVLGTHPAEGIARVIV